MNLVEVTTAKHKKDFILLPVSLYKNEPNWIRPLDKDIEAVFDAKQNKYFRHGECSRLLLYDENEKPIGRIAVFIDERTTKKEPQPTGGIGFFECINDKAAAHKMFDHCKQWLQQKGMEAMDGPINFGERDSWWGLIVDGFHSPQYKMNYNPSYYRELFESYGFQKYYEQWCYSLRIADRVQEKFYRRHEEIKTNPDYHAEFLKKKFLSKYADDFCTVYNKAWAKHGGGKELERKQVQQFFKTMKPVMDGEAIWFAYCKDEPIGMWINLPDLNQYFKKFNGKLGFVEKLRLLWMLKRRETRKLIGLVFGIVPEHQGRGVDALMIVEGQKHFVENNLYDDFEMQWIGDFNPRMVSIAENLGTKRSRVLNTYRYLFDRSKEFKRHPIL
ncbi:MAG TPA: hypothetical protein VI757_12650 [Bacteroidia bacterium]|nr:hypothetical protein [Bacteroidia bacterium]